MKKSVIEARQRALENSEVAPGILIRVMDKPHQHAAPEGALLALAKEVIAVGRLYGYDGKEMDA